jgi:bifunctional non-homologous end joining protein LigD
VVPLQRRHDWDEVKSFSNAVAELLEKADPHRYTSNMSKAARAGKIYVDYLRNGRTATAIAAYSTRARPRASVSVPLSWEELTPDIHSDTFTVRNVMDRLNSVRKEPWVDIGKIRQSLTASVKRKLGMR